MNAVLFMAWLPFRVLATSTVLVLSPIALTLDLMTHGTQTMDTLTDIWARRR